MSFSFAFFWIADSSLLQHRVRFSYLEPFPFPLKEALYGFSLAYPNCHHFSSCIFCPLLSKMKINETQACNTTTVDLITEIFTK